MQITGYGAIDQTQWPYEQNRKTRSRTESSGSRGDTVNFSDEALELLARSQAVKATTEETTAESASKDDQQEHSAGQSSNSRSSSVSTVSGSGSSSSSGEGFGDTAGEHSEGSSKDSAVHSQNKAAQETPDDDADIDAQIEKVKNEIVKVAQKISQIYSLPVDDQTKQGMAQPHEDRINQLQAQIAALEAKKEKQTESAPAGAK